MQSSEARKLAGFLDGLLLLLACVSFIGAGLMAWVAFRPDIQNALRLAQGFLFG